MKKKKKSTDSVLKDIFDPLHGSDRAASHPLSDMTQKKSDAPAEVAVRDFFEDELRTKLAPTDSESKKGRQATPEPVVSPEIETAKSGAPEVNFSSVLPASADEVDSAQVELELSAEPEPKTLEEVADFKESTRLQDGSVLPEFSAESPVLEPVKTATDILLPAKAAEQPSIPVAVAGPRSWKVVVSSLLSVAVVVGIYLWTQSEESRKTILLNQRQKEYTSFQKKSLTAQASTARIRQMASTLSAQQQSVAGTIRFLDIASMPATRFNPVFSALTRLKRDGWWLESVSFKNKKLFLKGFVFNQSALVKLINEMSSEPLFRNARVSLIQALPSEEGRKTKYAFEVYSDVNL